MNKLIKKIKNISLKAELLINLLLIVFASMATSLFFGPTELRQNIVAVDLVLLGAAFLIAYGLIYKNVRPIKELAETVHGFGKGNFSKRAEVYSENEIGQLAQEFNKMADKIQELDNSKTEFISFVSHQLKNPLSVINMNIELLKDHDITKKERDEYIDMIELTLAEVNELIDNLLNVSRIERSISRLNKENFNLEDLVHSVLKRLKVKADEKSINIVKKFSGDMNILSDKHILSVVVENLLSNAIKYTPQKGSVAIRVKNSNGMLFIEVEDNGFGISKEDRQKIFKKFFRSKTNGAGNTQGTGLGLYMVDKMVKKLNGKIKLKSKEGEGSTFYIAIPLD
ncbi:MAG: HAMP domain-containing sensor histidine kinase [Candidatus Spechtbacterales bacterium]|nr:HAMP domain-containing sensor histidine kinase [Candidatus Spechtbacterales bacterium]